MKLLVFILLSQMSTLVAQQQFVYTWGNNSFGQLGLGTEIENAVPKLIYTTDSILNINAGDYFNFIVVENQNYYAWGRNSFGQLGIPDTNLQSLLIKASLNFKQISAGDNHSLAIKIDGTLWSCGWNSSGQLGYLTDENKFSISWTKIGSDNDWQSVFAGASTSFAIKQDGTLWAWGYNLFGQLGLNEIKNISSPQQVSNHKWIKTASGRHFTIGLDSNNKLWFWGRQITKFQEVKIDDKVIIQPKAIYHDKVIIDIDAGGNHFIAIDSNNKLWGSGNNEYGQLGNSSLLLIDSLINIFPETKWKLVRAGEKHTVGIKIDGTLWTWGDNEFLQLGDYNEDYTFTANQLGDERDWEFIDAGAYHNIALKLTTLSTNFYTNKFKSRLKVIDGVLFIENQDNFGQLLVYNLLGEVVFIADLHEGNNSFTKVSILPQCLIAVLISKDKTLTEKVIFTN